MATAAGIDLGAHTVKLALVEGKLSAMEQVTYHLRAVPPGPDGEAPSLEARLAAAASLLEDVEAPRQGTWSAAYPADAASLRAVELPFTDRGQIDRTVGVEIEANVPFDMEDFLLDYRVIGTDGGRSRVLCALAERGTVGQLLAGLASTELDPRHLMLDAEALARLAGEGDGLRMVADIGHDRTLVAMVQDGALVGARAISAGGRDLTAAVVDALGVSWAEAEGIKHISQLSDAGSSEVMVEVDLSEGWEGPDTVTTTDPAPGPAASGPALSRDDLPDILLRALRPLLAELKTTAARFEEERDADIVELVLVGGTASLGGLPGYLSRSLGVVARAPTLSDEAERLGEPGRFALAHSLAARSAGATTGRELDFRKEEFSFAGNLERVKVAAGWAAAALAIFAVAAAVMFAVRYDQLGEELGGLDEQIADEVVEAFPGVSATAAGDPMMARAVVVEQVTATAARVKRLGATVGGDPPQLGLLREFSKALPKPADARIEVKEFKASESSVLIKAETTGYDAASAIETALKKNERFKEATRGDERPRSGGLSFSLTIPLETGDEEEEG